jgi:magnesium chelatase family protein
VTLARVHSAALLGIHAFPVEVEVDLQRGLPSFSTVGLPDVAVKESRDRVRAAILNTGFPFPEDRVTVNLAPADLRKEGSGFDLAIAVALLTVGGHLSTVPPDDMMLLGELSLDGGLKAVRGVLSAAITARERGYRRLIVPPANAGEAALVRDLTVYYARTLGEVAAFFREEKGLPEAEEGGGSELPVADPPDLADVRGQEGAKRALEVAAAGGHNLLMAGSPGAGKTMLARRLPGILPPMTFDEALETARISSVAGLLSRERPLARERPFRAPHHTVSYAGMVGGGARARPGEVTLAHNGVLFLDELPEFPRRVLESLRQPLEDGHLTIARAALALTYPAQFMLLGAMNPCPCGWRGDGRRVCRCTPHQIQRYRGRISGPLLDRIDVHLEVQGLEYHELTGDATGERSEVVAERVRKARDLQVRRLSGGEGRCSAAMTAPRVRKHCPIDGKSDSLLRAAVERYGLSARAVTSVLKVARTIADLADSEKIRHDHLAEAIGYRCLDRAIH